MGPNYRPVFNFHHPDHKSEEDSSRFWSYFTLMMKDRYRTSISTHFHYIVAEFDAPPQHSLALKAALDDNSIRKLSAKKIPPPTSTSIQIAIEASRLDKTPRNFSSSAALIYYLGKDDSSSRLKYRTMANLCPFQQFFFQCFAKISQNRNIFRHVIDLSYTTTPPMLHHEHTKRLRISRVIV